MKHRPFLALLVASGGFVIVLDSFAAAVAFPRLVAEFSSTPRSTLAWVSSGYSIALAALLLVAGAFADRYGVDEVMLSPVAGAYDAEPNDVPTGRAQTLELIAAALHR